MDKFLVTVSLYSDHSAGWDCWTDVKVVEFRGNNLQTLETEALKCKDLEGDYRSEINYYINSQVA